jgi:iodothyronine deiodinase-like protein
LYERYRERAKFYAVYILEAHPSDVWQMQSNIKDHVILRSPRDAAERSEVAGTCVRKLGIKFPALVDGFDNAAERAYTGWPDRLYLIDGQGRIVYKSLPGPFGFHPDKLQSQLERLLGPAAPGQRAAR